MGFLNKLNKMLGGAEIDPELAKAGAAYDAKQAVKNTKKQTNAAKIKPKRTVNIGDGAEAAMKRRQGLRKVYTGQ